MLVIDFSTADSKKLFERADGTVDYVKVDEFKLACLKEIREASLCFNEEQIFLMSTENLNLVHRVLCMFLIIMDLIITNKQK